MKDWNAAAQKFTLRDPRGYQWGVYVCWQPDPMCDDGQFLWFTNSLAASEFLVDGLGILFGVDPGGNDERDYREQIAAIAKLIERDGLSLEARVLFNETFRGWMRIAWWGSFQDLIKGKGGLLAENVVREFLSTQHVCGSEIPVAQVQRFIEWLPDRC